MYFGILLVLAAIFHVQTAAVCPYSGPICGSDNHLYKNICEWKSAAMLNPNLRIRNFGTCSLPYDLGNLGNRRPIRGNYQLRSKNKKPNLDDDNDDNDDYSETNYKLMQKMIENPEILSQIANMEFNFRRDPQEDQQEEDEFEE